MCLKANSIRLIATPDVRRTRILYEKACAHNQQQTEPNRQKKRAHTEHIKLLLHIHQKAQQLAQRNTQQQQQHQ